MEISTAIIDAQTSLLRELRETYIVLYGDRSGESDVARAAILRSIEKLALTTNLLVTPVSVSATQQMKPPSAEICKVTHDVVRIRNERNGQHGWENHAAAFCGISPKMAIEVWNAAVAKARPIIAEGDGETDGELLWEVNELDCFYAVQSRARCSRCGKKKTTATVGKGITDAEGAAHREMVRANCQNRRPDQVVDARPSGLGCDHIGYKFSGRAEVDEDTNATD